MWAAAWQASSDPTIATRLVVFVCSMRVHRMWWWQSKIAMISLDDVLCRKVGWLLGTSLRLL